MKHQWTELILQGRMTDDLKYLSNMVKKDVLRTDRHLPFYSGDSNTNVTILYNVLITYALNHPMVGYCQARNTFLISTCCQTTGTNRCPFFESIELLLNLNLTHLE